MKNPKPKAKNKRRHVLVAVTGVVPQVVTETLFVLMAERNHPVDEVFVVTTVEGKRALQGNPENGLRPFRDELKEMCNLYRVPMPAFDENRNIMVAKEESIELFDIRSDRDNQLFPNLIADLLRSLTSNPEIVLHCSIAGGRKTMSVALALGLSLFGRKDDTMYHVLASKEFEQSKRFYPSSRSESGQIILAEVPYVRLRHKVELLDQYPAASYMDLVKYAQGRVDDLLMLPLLRFDSRKRSVSIGDSTTSLPPFPFAVYTFFARQKLFVDGGKSFSQDSLQKLWKSYERLEPASGQKQRVAAGLFRKGAQPFLPIQKAISLIRRKIKILLKNSPIAEFYFVSVEGEYRNKRYGLRLPKSKIQVGG